ncbi:MAG: hypothetical protein RIF32_11625, partial [Leptospirales bacterium]
MNSKDSQDHQDIAEDVAAVPAPESGEAVGTGEGPGTGDYVAPADGDEAEPPPGKELLSEENLKAIMIQFNPHSFKDITTIQKGVENFFLFAQSHLALTHPEQLQHLGEKDLELLE